MPIRFSHINVTSLFGQAEMTLFSFSFDGLFSPSDGKCYKKVVLRERKRHTAHCVVNTPSVVLTGYPPILTWPGGYPGRVPPPAGYPLAGYPPAGYPPNRVPPSRVPPQQGNPPAGPGRVPPSTGCPMAFWEMLQSIMGYGNLPPHWLPHGILGNVAKHYGIWVPPPGVDKLTK